MSHVSLWAGRLWPDPEASPPSHQLGSILSAGIYSRYDPLPEKQHEIGGREMLNWDVELYALLSLRLSCLYWIKPTAASRASGASPSATASALCWDFNWLKELAIEPEQYEAESPGVNQTKLLNVSQAELCSLLPWCPAPAGTSTVCRQEWQNHGQGHPSHCCFQIHCVLLIYPVSSDRFRRLLLL